MNNSKTPRPAKDRPVQERRASSTKSPGEPSRVAVDHADGAFSVVALGAIRTGETILVIEGLVVDRPSRYSVQVGDGVHIELPPESSANGKPDSRYWQYLNHSCTPSAAIVDRKLVAVRPIAAGDAVTFDYNTTEYEMASPFRCACGTCDGRTIGGFKLLSPAEKSALGPRLAPYLRGYVPDLEVAKP